MSEEDGRFRGGYPIRLVSVLLVASAAAGAANAEGPDPALLAEMCAACHGPDGRSPGSIPSLAPLNEEQVRAFLVAYRNDDIEATVMGRIARALSDAEIEALARRFGNQVKQ